MDNQRAHIPFDNPNLAKARCWEYLLGMETKPHKFTFEEYAKNFCKDCADSLTNRFSAPFVLINLLLTLIALHYDITWLAVMSGELLILSAIFYTSYKQVERERDKVIALEKRLDPGIEWHIMDGLVPSSGVSAYCLLELNNGNKTLKDCRLMLDNQLIHQPFVLLSGEKKPIPLFKFSSAISDTMTVVNSYVQADGKWQMTSKASRVIIGGNYHLRLIAEDLYPPLEMTISIITHDSTANDWEIKEVMA